LDVQDVQRQLWVLSIMLDGLDRWLGPQSPEDAADLETVGVALAAETLPDHQRVGPTHATQKR
jgi:hypothetical protein